MWPTFKKYLKPDNYIHRWKKVRRRWKVSFLLKRNFTGADFQPLWELKLPSGRPVPENKVTVGAFDIPSDSKIDWMKDVPGKHVFPAIRMDKIKISDYYDQGIDVKYPWELSRFIFGSELAARYAASGDTSTYHRFRELVLDWIENNPFLVGVNWACTMDVAIRATNWILAANAFSGEMEQDPEFLRRFSGSLVEHGTYIQAFPEIYPGGHTTNHTTADYLGLLYVARALPAHPDASKWQQTAVQGLISCMEYQVYPDGGSFEASSGYHRLVTELFGLGALLCLNHGITLPETYYSKLDSMFGFLFSLSDRSGKVPLFGDNDSGTLLQFDFAQNQDYSYMHLFYTFLFKRETGSGKPAVNSSFGALMPAECKVHPKPGSASALKESEYRLFRDSGILAFRQGDLSGCINFIPIGQNGQGGHNHLDVGSFTLSCLDKALVVDPGTYTYTRDLQLRNSSRAYSHHNTLIPEGISDESFNRSKLFSLPPYFENLEYGFSDTRTFKLSYSLLNLPQVLSREFTWEKDCLTVSDSSPGSFRVKVHFGPEVKILKTGPGLIRTNLFTLGFSPDREFHLGEFEYADRYNTRTSSRVLTIHAESTANMKFLF